MQENNRDSCNLNAESIWTSLKSASCSSVVPPHSTLALTVQDPRISLPGKKTSIDATATQVKSGKVTCNTTSDWTSKQHCLAVTLQF